MQGWLEFQQEPGGGGSVGLRLHTCDFLGLGDGGPPPIRGKLSCRERRGLVERGTPYSTLVSRLKMATKVPSAAGWTCAPCPRKELPVMGSEQTELPTSV